MVSFDNVTEFVNYLGAKTNADSGTTDIQYTIATGNVQDIDTATDAGWVMINTYPGVADDANVYEARTYVSDVATQGDSFTDTPLSNQDIDIFAGGISQSFDGGASAPEYATMTALIAAINAASFDGTTVTAARDAKKVKKSRLSYTKSGVSTSISNIAASAKMIFQLGSATRTYAFPSTLVASQADGITMTELGDIISSTMSGTVDAGTQYNVGDENGVVTISALITQTQKVNMGNITIPSLSIVLTTTTGYQGLGSTTNTAASLAASSVVVGVSNVTVNGLRVTLANNSFSSAFDHTDTITGTNLSFTQVVSGTNTYGNNTWTVTFSGVQDNSDTGSSAGAIDATAWL